MPQISMHSPVGDLTISEQDGTIVSLDWGWAAVQSETPLLTMARTRLEAYFDGRLKSFGLPLNPPGTDWQRRSWAEMARIPYAETLSYGALADRLGSSARAIGGLCGANPIPIIIPCHRVLAAGGGLGGYSGAGGVETKLALLRLEGLRL